MKRLAIAVALAVLGAGAAHAECSDVMWQSSPNLCEAMRRNEQQARIPAPPVYPAPPVAPTDYTRYFAPPLAPGYGYGQISPETGLPRTNYVNGYYRADGTYVQPYYRSHR